MNIEHARFNMIEQQVRPWDVLDPRVLETLSVVPREQFVPAAYVDLAFADTSIPLSGGQEMMPPRVEGRILQALNLNRSETVLEIGTGSGFFAACLANLCRHVTSMEIDGELAAQARANLSAAGIVNVTVEQADAMSGWWSSAEYDAIAVTASMAVFPEDWLKALAPNGRLFVMVGEGPTMQGIVHHRVGDSQDFASECLFESELPALINAPTAELFQF